MRDPELAKDIAEIAGWLDSLIVEVNKINEVVEDLIAQVPQSLLK
jgi:hypothetical protein